EELHDDTPAETQSAKDKGKGIFIKDLKPMKKKDQIAIDAEYARKLQEEEESLAQAKDAQAIDVQPKDAPGKTYDQIRPIFQDRFDANMIFLLKSKEEMEKEQEEIIKSINETLAQKAAKRRRLREQAKEAEDLKKQLEVVADEDDDVFVEATPIGTKVPVVNYKIVMINNKSREDLEDLWKIVKARFSTSKPNNFTDDNLLATLKNMFEKTDAQDFARVMTKYGVTHRLATTYHPQTSSQVEVSNRGLKRILERTVGENHASWSDKLDDALWAFRTAFKTPIGCTPYKMVYRNSCHLPIELKHKVYWALKHVNFDLKTGGDHRKLQLNELNELHDQAYENSWIYKERTKKLHDSKIKNRIFNVGDQFLLFNSRLKIFSGKLKTRWSRPFTITQVFPYGIVELSQPNGPNFK
nr:reverse transcriptase domain-containing protein [Tanacetum cinerariifolium]